MNPGIVVEQFANAFREFVGAAFTLPGAVCARPKMRNDVGLDALPGETRFHIVRELRSTLEPFVAIRALGGIACAVNGDDGDFVRILRHATPPCDESYDGRGSVSNLMQRKRNRFLGFSLLRQHWFRTFPMLEDRPILRERVLAAVAMSAIFIGGGM